MERTHIIWDWNGTLFDDAVVCWEICKTVSLEYQGRAPSFDEFRKMFTIPVDTFWYSLLGRHITPSEMQDIGERFHSYYLERRSECSMHEGAQEVLVELSRGGVSHSILSSAPQALLDSIVNICGIRSSFLLVQGHPGAGGSSKIPLGREHMKQLQLDPKNTILIGDTVHDHELANALGVGSLLFSRGSQCPSKLKATSAPVIESLRELLEIKIL